MTRIVFLVISGQRLITIVDQTL